MAAAALFDMAASQRSTAQTIGRVDPATGPEAREAQLGQLYNPASTAGPAKRIRKKGRMLNFCFLFLSNPGSAGVAVNSLRLISGSQQKRLIFFGLIEETYSFPD